MSGSSRRKFMERAGTLGAAALSNPFPLLLQGLVNSFVEKAIAQATGNQSRYLFRYHMMQAPPRWIFDLPLRPHAGMTVQANNAVKTHFQALAPGATNYTVPIYGTVPIRFDKGTSFEQIIQMPHMWSYDIPTTSGSPVQIEDALANNMGIFRGFTMRRDGHENNKPATDLAPGSGISVSGAVADSYLNSRLLPAVAFGRVGAQGFRAASGIGISTPGSGSPIQSLLQPFISPSSSPVPSIMGGATRRAAMDTAVSAAMDALKDYTNTSHTAADALFQMRHTADQYFRTGFGNLSLTYTNLYNKYLGLCTSAVRAVHAGVNDAPVLNTLTNDPNCGNIITGASFLPAGYDFSQMCSTAVVDTDLPATFAIAEYLFTSGYTACITQASGHGLTGCFHPAGSGSYFASGSDEHGINVYQSMMANTSWYRAFGACFHEFVKTIKQTAGLWDNMVFLLCSEFERSPQGGLAGYGASDHAWYGNHFTMWSGAIKKSFITGNIRIHGGTDRDALYNGTIGTAANTNHGGSNGLLEIKHAMNTVAALLNLPPVAGANFPSVIVPHATYGFESVLGMPQNV